MPRSYLHTHIASSRNKTCGTDSPETEPILNLTLIFTDPNARPCTTHINTQAKSAMAGLFRRARSKDKSYESAAPSLKKMLVRAFNGGQSPPKKATPVRTHRSRYIK